ncbi:MAG: Xaa-Pro peptidase family protein [Streptosporangiaceae bacterium]
MSDIHAARRALAQQRVRQTGADAALITSPPNVRYLSGLVSSNMAMLLLADGPAVLGTDSRYAEAAARDCPDVELVVERELAPALARLAVERGCRTLAVEAQHMTVEQHAALEAQQNGPRLVPLGHPVEELRMVKDPTEIELLATACSLTDQAFAAVLGAVEPGRTEREVAILLERAMVDLGAEGPAFDTIVASGPHGAIPHHSPGSRALERGDLVVIDCGARYRGYHADMTRTVCLGSPEPWQREIYDLVAAAQLAGLAAARPGAELGDVDAAARSIIAAAGYGDHFGHGLGHGVGLEVHEAPMLGPGRAGKLQELVPITVEPGIYLPGKGGVRVEDTVVVRATGPATLITTSRDLLVL